MIHHDPIIHSLPATGITSPWRLPLVHALDLQHVPPRIDHQHLAAAAPIIATVHVDKVSGTDLPGANHVPQKTSENF